MAENRGMIVFKAWCFQVRNNFSRLEDIGLESLSFELQKARNSQRCRKFNLLPSDLPYSQMWQNRGDKSMSSFLIFFRHQAFVGECVGVKEFLCKGPRGVAAIMTVHFKDVINAKSERSLQSEADSSFLYGVAGVDLYRAFGKQCFDTLFVIAMAPIALVLIGAAVLLTAMDGHAPFFWQKRVGRNGREFWMLKIRTMVPDAEAKLEAYLKHHPTARREWEEKQKLDEDPRITRLGAFLRKSSLDELTQLWNVLRGDMSLVGPRPMMVAQRRLYPGRAYFKLRPGITGNWQISDRNKCSFAGRAVFDDEYEAGLSLKTDLEILVRTAGVVIHCTGR